MKKFLWALLVSFTYAQKVGVKSEIGYGCFASALAWNYDCPSVLLPLDCRCSQKNFLATVMSCVVEYSSDVDQVVKAWSYIGAQCHYWGNVTYSIEDMQRVYFETKDTLIDPSTLNDTEAAVPAPIKIPENLFREQYEAAADIKYHYKVGDQFAWGIVGYWGLIMVGAIITNAIRILNPKIYDVIGDERVTRLRKFLTLPALVGKRHQSSYRLIRYLKFQLPTRGQFLIMLGFVAIDIAGIVSFLSVKGFTPLSFTNKSDRILHYLANRTGIMAFSHIPLLTLFACRNNPLIYLTGWSYDTFMVYHRICARMMGTLALIHSVCIYWSSINEHVVMFKWKRVHNWRGGNIATYLVIFMLILGMRRIRSRIYEIFKSTHVLMFVIMISCLIAHCSDYGWLGWLWATVAFYFAEYLARLTSIIMSGGIQTAEFTLTEAGMYHVNIPGGKRKWDVKPGAYVYITVLDKHTFWQSHPFSVFQSYKSRESNSLDFCCKAQMGATFRMLKSLQMAPSKSLKKKVLIEGPYGHENYICDYDSILLFAGGVGFTAMYNFASNIVQRLKGDQELCIFWVVKDCKHLRAFEDELAHLARNLSEKCTMKIFVTRPEEMELGTVGLTSEAFQNNRRGDSGSDISDSVHPGDFDHSKLTVVGSSHKHVLESSNEYDHYKRYSNDEEEDACRILVDGDVLLNIEYGRPDISAGVSDFIKLAAGSKAIVSCGPPLFVDAIRDGIVQSIVGSESRVDYFEDAFSW